MSEKLGPIHYQMYEKIKFQDDISKFLMDDNTSEIDKDLEPVSRKDLAEIIDQDNVHGYLASKIDVVENRLAKAIKLSSDPKKKMYELGVSKAEDFSSYQDLFNKLNSYLLDGMPCDNALSAGIDPEGNLLLITNDNLHSKYQKAYVNPDDSLNASCGGGDHDHHHSFDLKELDGENLKEENSTYHDYRYEFIKGFLSKSSYGVDLVNGINYKIYQK
ncbi:MAG: hypothetical protein Q4D88_00130 [Anaerococcus sp.]|nr:hypothetical protein [Anaerococcus sp.]